MSDNKFRISAGALVAAATLLASACTSPSDHDDQPMAAGVTVNDQWASAADAGMAAMFGTFSNAGHHGAHIVAGHSPAAGRVEIHEVVADEGGTKTMRPKSGGLTVPAEGTHELVPGGDHLMLMDLRQPLRPGAEVTLTVVFEDGSELPVTAQIRDFAGGHEDYQPGSQSHG
ncbi:copper chaperone PCu(A)C [Mycolicibacterium pyrenivorans]|uniref:copper chaperone PCu(A)C n=1 Tax=Mycolicibacterium pyrenivorans TaxID=187102 RepID=UPI0021F2B631|nr:copper chaperone PCu(A)C [Mycolicibacterium pyrenivorans]MCV7154243.1 copper chaperone PCu(A)C [Mycolicibacterium pyrenivorans]